MAVRLLDGWDRGFEYRRGYGCATLVFVVCCDLCDELIIRSEGLFRVRPELGCRPTEKKSAEGIAVRVSFS